MESSNMKMLTNSIKMQYLLSRGNSILRNIFSERWAKYNGSDWNSSSARTFTFGIGRKVYDKFQKFHIQRETIEAGDLNEWDLTTLTDVLILTDFPTEIVSRQTKSFERSKLEELKKIRNKLAHAPSLGIEDEQFESMWRSASEVLVFFGCSNEDLVKIKSSSNLSAFQDENSSGHVNMANSEEATRLKNEANEFYRNGEFKKSIEVYSKAISLGRLLDSEKAILYSNRSVCYLKIAGKNKRHENSEEIHCAVQDGKEAIKLNPTWFRGYFRTGNAYFELGKFREALEYFDSALSLSPGQGDVRQGRDNCRIKLGQEARQDHMETSRIGEDDEANTKRFTPGGTYVQQAHQSLLNDPEMAAKLYAKSASLGNAEGMYNLGLLYKDGRGVKQDLNMYIKLMKQSATKPHVLPGVQFKNVGVAEAEHSLGLAYEDGIGVIQDVATAADWYHKSSDHGCSAGSHNLALLFMSGRGVPNLDVEQGVEYFKLAASRGNALSMRSLAEHYLNVEEDPQQAREWFQLAVKHGNLNAQLDATEFEDKLKNLEIKNKGVEDMVRIYENQNGLSGEGMTLKIRVKRMKRGLNPGLSNAEEGLHSILSNSTVEGATPVCKISRQFDPHVLKKYVKKGSETAVRIQSAVSHFEVFWDLYHSHQSDLRKEGTKIIHELSECFRIEHIVAQITQPMKEQMFHLVGEVLKMNETSELDKDARVCYGYLQMDTLESTLVFMEHSKRKYPNEKALHAYYSDLCGFLRKHDVGIRALEKSLELFPNDVDLLYGKATHTRLLEQDHSLENVVKAYQEFLAVAPPDHRWAPEVHYAIANEYFFTCYGNANPSQGQLNPMAIIEGFAKMEDYYRLGLQAEKKQLPFFLPYVCSQRDMVENNQCLMEGIKSKCSMFFGQRMAKVQTPIPSKTKAMPKTQAEVKVIPKIQPVVKAGAKGQPDAKSILKTDMVKAKKTPDPKCTNSLDVKVKPEPIDQPEPEPDYTKLADLNRTLTLKTHREHISERRHILTNKTKMVIPTIETSTNSKRGPVQFVGLKPITFTEMNTKEDKIYEGHVIKVTSVDDAGFRAYPYIRLVLQDENGSLFRAFVYNFPDTDVKVVQQKLGFGAKFSILNPYIKLGEDGKFGLQVSDEFLLFLHSPATNGCRFCMIEKVDLRSCSKCKWANYCSRECQEMDWKLASHKLICSPSPF